MARNNMYMGSFFLLNSLGTKMTFGNSALLTLGITLALNLPSMAASSLTAAIFLSALVLVAALLSIFAR